jgi:Surface-adhesin protein E
MIGSKTGLRIQLVAVSCLLMFVAACSRAVPTDWIMVKDRTLTGDGSVTYAAPSTIRKSGTKVRMWSLIDSKDIQGTALDRPHTSWMDEWEYECQNKSFSPMVFREYSGKMGTGENMFSLTPASNQWLAVRPGSVSETLWTIACGKE